MTHDPLIAAAERDYAAAHGDAPPPVGSTTTAREILRLLTDDELVRIWQRCGGDCDDPVSEAIVEEMGRREIDF